MSSRAGSKSTITTLVNPPEMLDLPQPQEAKKFKFRITKRAVILLVILAMLALTYANSLRVFFDQKAQLAEARTEIQLKQRRINQLQDEIERWEDPGYVRAQARSRLGWVVPGEIGYRVLGPDGKLITASGVEIAKPVENPETTSLNWWKKLWGSIKTADDPVLGADKPRPTPIPSAVPTSAER